MHLTDSQKSFMKTMYSTGKPLRTRTHRNGKRVSEVDCVSVLYSDITRMEYLGMISAVFRCGEDVDYELTVLGRIDARNEYSKQDKQRCI